MTVAQTITAFDHPKVAAVTIPFINILKDKELIMTQAPSADGVWITSEYYAGMVMFRKSVFLAVGGYWEPLFIQDKEATCPFEC